jgi:hypothetical protein
MGNPPSASRQKSLPVRSFHVIRPRAQTSLAGADAPSPIGLLGRHEQRRPEGLRAGLLRVGHQLGDAEVEDLRGERGAGAARRREEHVLQLEVAVHDALGVGELQGVAPLA